jgi:predicted nucleic acid-binding protein
MNGSKCFVDTNIVLYAHTDQSPDKQDMQHQQLISGVLTIINPFL